MKRLFCFVLIISMLLCALPFSAGAVEAAKTEFSVKNGDNVTYELFVDDLNEKVVGCEFSVYYDSSVLEIDSVADYTGSTDEDDWRAFVNYKNVEGEIFENWSVLSGVKITSAKPIITVNFKAKSSDKTHISYYIRYMYPESLVQFTEYTFTCNVTVNGKKVLEAEQPELNTEPKTQQSSGEFVNSVTGKSEDAGKGISKVSDTDSKSNKSSNSSLNSNFESGENGGEIEEKDDKVSSNAEGESEDEKNNTDETNFVSDNSEASKSEASKSEASSNKASKGNFPYALWIVIGLIILLIAGAGGYYFIKVKKNKNK